MAPILAAAEHRHAAIAVHFIHEASMSQPEHRMGGDHGSGASLPLPYAAAERCGMPGDDVWRSSIRIEAAGHALRMRKSRDAARP